MTAFSSFPFTLATFGFAAPWLMLGAAALAVPTLIILYCLKLRRREVMIGSTFLWQSAVADLQANTPFQRIRPSWLLFLQLLALLLLLLAIGRPIWGETEVRGQRIILLIDISASMQAILPTPDTPRELLFAPEGPDATAPAPPSDTASPADAAADTGADAEAGVNESVSASRLPTRFDRARETALELIDRLGRGDETAEIMIIALGARARTALSFTSDRRQLRATLADLAPVDETGDLAAALRLARAFAERGDDGAAESADGGDSAAEARVVLISDGRLAIDTGIDVSGLDFEYLPVLGLDRFAPLFSEQSDGEARVGDPAALAAIENVGVVALSARRDDANPERVDAFAVLQNSSLRPRTVGVEIEVDGVRLESRVVTLPPAEAIAAPEAVTRAANEDVEADSSVAATSGGVGEAVVGFSFIAEASPVLRVRHTLRDALPTDNAATVVVAPPRRGPLLVVAPGGEADPLVTDVLELLAFRTIRTVTPEQYAELEARGVDGVRDALLPFDLIIFDGVAAPFLPPSPSISFGAVPAIPGVEVIDASRDTVVDRAGADETSASAPDGTPARRRLSRRVLSWDRDHPIMANLELGELAVADPTRLRIPEELDYARRLVIADGGPAIALFENVPVIPPSLQARIDAWIRGPDDSSPEGADRAPVNMNEGEAEGGSPERAPEVNPLIEALSQGRTLARNPAAHLVVAFDLVRSNWPIDRTFALFLKNAVDGLTSGGQTDRGRWLRAEESVRATLAADVSPRTQEVAIEGPKSLTVSVEDDGTINIPPLERVGLYRIPEAAPPNDRLAVNLLSPIESDLRPVWQLDFAGENRAEAKTVGDTVPFEAWPWFVFAALIILTIEWMLYATRARY